MTCASFDHLSPGLNAKHIAYCPLYIEIVERSSDDTHVYTPLKKQQISVKTLDANGMKVGPVRQNLNQESVFLSDLSSPRDTKS